MASGCGRIVVLLPLLERAAESRLDDGGRGGDGGLGGDGGRDGDGLSAGGGVPG